MGALLALGPIAAFALLASDLPRVAAWPLAGAVLAFAGWRAWREANLPRRLLVLPGNGSRATLDGQPILQAQVQWRGPLAFLRWRDRQGRSQRLSWWPDTLPQASRRELRLAASSLEAARNHRRMAP
jgi:toxin CptA